MYVPLEGAYVKGSGKGAFAEQKGGEMVATLSVDYR